MAKSLLRNTWFPIVLAGTFILLDLLTDSVTGCRPKFDLAHLGLTALIFVVSFAVVHRATETRRRAEASLREAHDDLERRVHERVAELESIDAALRQVNERLELTQAASGAGFWDWDLASGRIEWSPRMFDLFGLEMRDTAASLDAWRSVLHPEDRKEVERQLDLAIESHSDLAIEYRIIRPDPDGKVRWISTLGKGTYDEQGRPIRMSGLCLDVTDQNLADLRIEHLASFPEMNPNPVLEFDASGEPVYRNAGAARALKGGGLEDDARVFLPDDLSVILQALHQQEKSAFRREVLVGSSTFAETVQTIPALDVLRVYAFEITDRLQAEEALRRSEEKYRLLFQNMAEGFALYELLYDEQGRPADWRVLEVNDAYTHHTGVARDFIVGRLASELFPDAIPEYLPRFAEVVASQVPVVFETFAKMTGRYQRVFTFPAGSRRFASTIEDITDRKQAAEALRASQLQVEAEKRHLEAVLQALPVGVIITDAQGGVLLTNGMDEQIWGRRPMTRNVDDYGQYKAWWVDSGKPVQPHEWASAHAVLKGEPVFGQILEIQRFDEGRGFVLNSAVPIRDGEGHITGSAVAIQDITQLRRAEQALRDSEARFRTVVENSRDGINMLDLETGRYTFISPAQVMLTGFGAEELHNLSAEETYERIHPADREKLIAQQREIAEGRDDESTMEYRWKVKSGEYRWFSDSRKVVRDQQGRAVALVGVTRDVTEQRQAAEALRASEEKFAAVFRFSPTGLAIARTRDGTFVDVNQAFASALGYEPSELIGKRVGEADLIVSGDTQTRAVRQVLEGRQVVDHELELRTKNGEIATMLASLATIQVGDEPCVLAVAHDITERLRYQRALHRAEAALALADREKVVLEQRQRLARDLHDSVAQALYSISLGAHTALALIDGDRNGVVEALDYIISMARNGMDEMRALVFELRPESLEVEGLVAALNRQLAALRARHGIEIGSSLCDEPAAELAIKEALYRIAQEALQNAIRHAEADHLEVCLTCEPDGVRLEVSDNGRGFDPQGLFPGHLGLQSMRERAEGVGGTLEILSEPRRGTCVCAAIPIPTLAQ
jgi:PAS domain S-box-containing protein